ncbi:MAG: polysaccharide export protein EpsE [Cytophagales bacterium]|nr:polysaccharide export protein EpsE [Cytophagales bacterium]
MPKTIYYYTIYALFILCLISCRGYKQNIMFKTEKSVFAVELKGAVKKAERNYVIRKDDYLGIRVYTNYGESLIDPNMELFRDGNRNVQSYEDRQKYLVKYDGFVKLPMVGKIKLDGLTLNQADSLLERRYSEFYEDVFCVTKLLNRRVVVLGAIGGQVVPLENENMNLLEILALAGGIDNLSKVQNIRIIRGDLKDPDIYLIDLSTIEGMKQANLNVQPNDIIYIEPVRKVLIESVRDISPILAVVTNIITLILIIITLSQP